MAARKLAVSADEREDQRLARLAAQKISAGEVPTGPESAALRRVRKRQEEADRWTYYATVPKKHYLEMSGRPATIVNAQAALHGIPIGKAKIDLGAVIRWMHDFLAKHKNVIRAAAGDDPLMVGSDSPGLERYRQARAEIAEFDAAERRGIMLRKADVLEAMGLAGDVLRQAGARLQKKFGPDALRIMHQGLDDFERLVKERFGEG